MEEDNNNLGDFFRKRLSSGEGEDADWFNPDPRTDELVLKGLVASSGSKKKRKQWIFILLPCFALLGMLGYIIHLKHHIALLNDSTTRILAQNTFTTPISTTTTENTATHTNTSVIKKEKNKKENKNLATAIATEQIDAKNKAQATFWANLEKENQALQKVIEQKDKAIQALRFELSQNCNQANSSQEIMASINANASTNAIDFKRLFPSFATQSILPNKLPTTFGSTNLFSQDNFNAVLGPSTLAEIDVVGTPSFENLSTIKPGFLTVPFEKTKAIPDNSFSLKNKKKRKINSLEIGVQIGLLQLLTEKKVEIVDQRAFLEELEPRTIALPYASFNIAYSPIKNLWIRTGVQAGINTDDNKEEAVIVYDDAQEYLLPSGDRGSDLVINTFTGYTEVENTLALRLPSTIVNGDLLELEYQQKLSMKHLHIPLSVEYFFGKKKWQPFIHVGAKWNLFQYEYTGSYFELKSDNQEINFNLKEGSTNAETIQYISLMTGVGMSCNLRPKLSLRGTVGFEMNHMLTNETTTFMYSTNGISVGLGLHYKF